MRYLRWALKDEGRMKSWGHSRKRGQWSTRGDRQAHPFYPPSTLDHLLTPEGVTDFQHLSSGLPSSSPENLLSFDSTYTNHQFSRLVMSNSLRPHGLQHARPPCPTPTPRVYSNSCHWVGDAIQPSHPLPSPSPSAFNLSQHQGLFQWVGSSLMLCVILRAHLSLE